MTDYRSAAVSAIPAWIGDQRDPKAWAKRIMYREERKCSELTPIQVEFAKMALGLATSKNDKKG